MRVSGEPLSVPFYLLFPLASAIIYALGSIFIKRALAEGASMKQTFHLSNFVMGAMFLPLIFFEKEVIDWSQAWKPVLMGVTFFFGMWTTFVGIRRGDVSLVTPLLGTKVVFVAIIVVLLIGKMPSVTLWIAALLTALGIFLIGWKDMKSGVEGMRFAILITLLSAAIFGLSDVLVRWLAGGFGALAFLTISSLTVTVISFAMWCGQKRPSLKLGSAAAKWGWLGAVMMGLQAIGIGWALSFYDDATGVNVVYASRGLWAILIIALLGTQLGNDERRTSGKSFVWRLVGTLLLTAAVVIAVMDRSS